MIICMHGGRFQARKIRTSCQIDDHRESEVDHQGSAAVADEREITTHTKPGRVLHSIQALRMMQATGASAQVASVFRVIPTWPTVRVIDIAICITSPIWALGAPTRCRDYCHCFRHLLSHDACSLAKAMWPLYDQSGQHAGLLEHNKQL